MAVAFESVSAVATGSNSVTPDKPTGLTVGDLMVAVLAINDTSGSGATWEQKTGWTRLFNTIAEDDVSLSVQCKVADASDVSASNFTFTADTGLTAQGVIYRISGAANPSDIVFSSNGPLASNFTTATTETITPIVANSLLIMMVASQSNGQGYSGYSIATDNPMWTERVDNTTSIFTIASATASRPETTATGTASMTPATTGSGSSEYVAALIAIPPVVNGSVTTTVISLTSTVLASTNIGTANITTNPVTISSTIPTQSATTAETKYKNTDKSVPSSMSNLDKS